MNCAAGREEAGLRFPLRLHKDTGHLGPDTLDKNLVALWEHKPAEYVLAYWHCCLAFLIQTRSVRH